MLNIYKLIEEIENDNSIEKQIEEDSKKEEEKIILDKTYVKINKSYEWFLEEINNLIEKLQKIMKEKKDLLEKIKEKENLKIKITKNLEEIKRDFYKVYTLLLSEESAPPLIVEKKLKSNSHLFKEGSIKIKDYKTEKSKEVNKNNIRKSSVLEKIEKELKKIEEELKELGIS